MDARLNPKDLQEYLQPLIKELAEDLALWEREELAMAIYEYMFSSGPDDMGWTDLVAHSIDTAENRPIGLPPRRLPITKQDMEQTKVQTMLYQGVIEPCQSS